MTPEKDRLIVVLDDDPTGVQTVHDVYVYTRWDRETVLEAFRREKRMFFILPAASMTSRRIIGSPPASMMKLTPRSSASVKTFCHSSADSWRTGVSSTVALLQRE